MSQFLHDFIHNLSMSEKAYFNRFTRKYSDKPEKNYLKLYRVLEQMPIYEEATLKQHFEGTSIGRYMSSELNYLQEQLLKSLFNFYLEKNPERKLYKSILFIDILLEKGYRKRAGKILRHAKKVAYRI